MLRYLLPLLPLLFVAPVARAAERTQWMWRW